MLGSVRLLPPRPRRGFATSAALAVAALAMVQPESWSHVVGVVIGCVVFVLAVALLWIPERPPPEPPVQKHQHKWAPSLDNPTGKPPGLP